MATVDLASMHTWAARSRGWIALVVLAPFAVATMLSTPIAFEGSWTDMGFDIVAWGLFLAGAAVRWWSTLYIGSRKTSTLVIEGPYSVCRNPLYVGTFLMGLAVAVFLESATFGAGMMLAAAIYLSTTVPIEERRLRDRFGETYVRYCESVPRFWPRLSNFNAPATIQVSTKGLLAEGFRAIRWIWLPILCELIAELRAQPNWPRILKLP